MTGNKPPLLSDGVGSDGVGSGVGAGSVMTGVDGVSTTTGASTEPVLTLGVGVDSTGIALDGAGD